jgi:hypothetical protein
MNMAHFLIINSTQSNSHYYTNLRHSNHRGSSQFRIY